MCGWGCFKSQVLSDEAEPKEKAKRLEERKSHDVFKKKFPNRDVFVFFELYDLIVAEAKLKD